MLPWDANSAAPNEVLADAADAGWSNAVRLAFAWQSLSVIIGPELNGQNTDSTPLLECYSPNYGFPLPPRGRPAPNLWSAIANRAQAVLVKDGIIGLEKPAIEATASLSLVPLLRSYIRRGNLAVPEMFAMRGIFDPNLN